MNLYIQEESVNKTDGYRCGDSGVFESRFENKSDVYKYCLREHGRCTGKVYVGDGQHVGWIFLKQVKYDDSKETFLCETWITLHTAMPVRSITYQYA